MDVRQECSLLGAWVCSVALLVTPVHQHDIETVDLPQMTCSAAVNNLARRTFVEDSTSGSGFKLIDHCRASARKHMGHLVGFKVLRVSLLSLLGIDVFNTM